MGQYTFGETNDQYMGQWEQGDQEGLGRLVFSNGDFYEGLFQKARRSGQGALYYADGSIYEVPSIHTYIHAHTYRHTIVPFARVRACVCGCASGNVGRFARG